MGYIRPRISCHSHHHVHPLRNMKLLHFMFHQITNTMIPHLLF